MPATHAARMSRKRGRIVLVGVTGLFLLVQHGAILFRGFDVPAVHTFNDFISSLSSDPIFYSERSSPRRPGSPGAP